MPQSATGQNLAEPRKAAIAFILITLLIDILGIGIVIPVLPELVKAFVGGDSSTAGFYVGTIGATYSLMQFIFAPILGALSDRFGRRPVLLASLFGLSIDYLIQGFAPSLIWLFVGRLVAGIMGASFTAANAYIADVSNETNRARNFGLVGVMFGIGFIIGPSLGGFLGGIDLRLPFFVSAALAFANGLYGYFILPESLPKESRSPFNLAKFNPLGALSYLRKYPMVAGIATAVLFSSLAQRGLENVWVLYTGFRYQWDQSTNGYVLGLLGFTAVIVQGGLVGPIVRRFGPRRVAIFATVVMSIGYMGYGLSHQGWMIPIVIVFGSLGGLAGPSIQSLVTSQVSATDQGKVQGAIASIVSLTSIAAPLIFSAGLFRYFTSKEAVMQLPGAPFFLGSILLLTAASILFVVFRRFPAPDSSNPPT
jgi:MFS transporter, DHA1 family, tetracycline resistance protein